MWWNGLFELPIWGYIVITLTLMHITVMSITLYLHRNQAHKSVELHPLLAHFFRFWLWLTTATVTKQWVAVHRKHHAHTETKDDPHSPYVFGIKHVLAQGAELYRKEALNQETQQRYGQGTPNDWLEKYVYTPHSISGVVLLLFVQVLLFGIPGITIWGIQMLTSPILAAGIINGVGHYLGYRNFETPDASRNIVPWGIFIGGEELHNNHHAAPISAKFSAKAWEFDIGWFYLTLFKWVGLAHTLKSSFTKEQAKWNLAHRFHILKMYSKDVMLPLLQQEKSKAQIACQNFWKNSKQALLKPDTLVDSETKLKLQALFEQSKSLEVVYQYRKRLQALWQQTALSHKEWLEELREWCKQAEATGIQRLAEFSRTLQAQTH